MKSSSESIPVVTGVGGAATLATEATIFLLAMSCSVGEVIVASVAFLFLVVGGMLAVARWWLRPVTSQAESSVRRGEAMIGLSRVATRGVEVDEGE